MARTVSLPLGHLESPVISFTDPTQSFAENFALDIEGGLNFDPLHILDRESRTYSFDLSSMPVAAQRLDISLPSPQMSAGGSTLASNPAAVSPDSSGLSNAANTADTPESIGPYGELVQSTYPATLPPQHIVEHLVEIYFTSVPNGNRILHRPSFLTMLRHSPGNKQYPSTTLLHAICATASYASSIIEIPPLPDGVHYMYEVFVPPYVLEQEHNMATGKHVSFSLEQAVLARAMIELDTRTGRQPIMATTALLVLCWYYVSG
jgi:hypothetical protein